MKSVAAWAFALLATTGGAVAGSGATGLAPPPATAAAAAADVASDVVVSTRLSPDPSHIGDLLTLEVVVAYPKGFTVSLPAGLSLAPLHLVDVAEGPVEPTGEGLRKVFTIRLQAFDVGDLETPAFPVTYVDPDGEVRTVTVPPRSFAVERLTANEVDPERKGEDPPISLPYPNETAETAIWAVLGTLLAVLVAYGIYRRFFARRTAPPAPPPIPPHEEALARLEALEARDLPGQGRFQEYYLELTEIARAYLERRFGIPALDRTTEEIRRALVRAGSRIAPIDPDAFVRFLQRADLVKFARMEAEQDEARRAMEYVREVVEATRPDRGASEAGGAGTDARRGGPGETNRSSKTSSPTDGGAS
ncbi:MAG: hypothetical protein D6705_03085 [Deltaproteobacteria bacterium]|nr:MAG: hypothetical protein D6705_03085 [Deltaproteobacteria bacterium]